MQVEIWKEIPGYPRYEASNTGKIRSWVGKRSTIRKTPKLLKPILAASGKRFMVMLYHNKKVKRLYWHRIILITFVGLGPKGTECCHNDGNFANNILENLRWDTHKSNMQDAIKHKDTPQGVDVHGSKLNPEKVIAIRNRFHNGEMMKDIAKDYGIGISGVQGVVYGKNWKTVGGPIATKYRRISYTDKKIGSVHHNRQ